MGTKVDPEVVEPTDPGVLEFYRHYAKAFSNLTDMGGFKAFGLYIIQQGYMYVANFKTGKYAKVTGIEGFKAKYLPMPLPKRFTDTCSKIVDSWAGWCHEVWQPVCTMRSKCVKGQCVC